MPERPSFDVETAISAWRRAFSHRRAFRARDLDELERHLRDHVLRLCHEGYDLESAFHAAMLELGDCTEAEDEYEKVYWGKLRRDRTRIHELVARATMLTTYIRVAYRNVRKHATYSFINVAGLALGLAVCLLIGLYVHHEWSYDRFHEASDQLYRLATETRSDAVRQRALTGITLAPTLRTQVPEVETATRLAPHTATVRHNNQTFPEQRIILADSTFFDLFSFPLLRGVPETALVAPHSLVLTQRAAERFFGEVNPVGQTLDATFFGQTATYTITGVAATPPSNSHIQFDGLRSFTTIEDPHSPPRGFMFTYAKLRLDARLGDMPAQLDSVVVGLFGREALAGMSYFLQPVPDIHLHSTLSNDFHAGQSAEIIYIIAAIGFFILLIATINFVNLSTARSSERAREVGVRKTLGAHRGGLMGQFLTESVLLTLVAVVLALVLAILLLPLFTSLTPVDFQASDLLSAPVLRVMLLLGIVVGTLAGLYPAVVLSGFKPVRVLKGRVLPTRGNARFRQTLVVVQFTITIAILSTTTIALQQLDYIQTKDLGFERDYIVGVAAPEGAAQVRRFTNAFAAIPGVQDLSAVSSARIGTAGQRYLQHPQFDTAFVQINFQSVDAEYTQMLDMKLAAGRHFSPEIASDSTTGALLNESAVRALGWATPEEAVGQTIGFGRTQWTVVGVVADYHYQSLHRPIEPLLLQWRPGGLRQVLVRIQPNQLTPTLAALETVWNQQVQDRPFEVRFLDDQLAMLYQNDRRQSRIFGAFAGMAILIAGLGVFGLAAFAATRRTKEVGIRKVLGASVPSLLGLFAKEFIKLIVLAALVSAPLAYLVMQQWLHNFAYRVEVGVDAFIFPALLALAIALVTVSVQSLKAALANPIEALRYE